MRLGGEKPLVGVELYISLKMRRSRVSGLVAVDDVLRSGGVEGGQDIPNSFVRIVDGKAPIFSLHAAGIGIV